MRTDGTTFGTCGSPFICESARSHPWLFARPSPLTSFWLHVYFRCQFESPAPVQHLDRAFQSQDELLSHYQSPFSMNEVYFPNKAPPDRVVLAPTPKNS
jgi:hypothetical protein